MKAKKNQVAQKSAKKTAAKSVKPIAAAKNEKRTPMDIPVGKLKHAPWNPREVITPASVADLEASIVASNSKRKGRPMSEKKNALAELAERLEEIKGLSVIRTMIHDEYTIALDKSQRIVAELAKVEKPIGIRTVGMTHLADILEVDKNRAVEIVRNCRAIAEEGVK